MSENQKYLLNISADQALFEGQVQGLLVTIFKNERPLAGLSGTLDWYFQGAISSLIQKGAISGKLGECTYFPYNRHGTTFHILLSGGGDSESPGARTQISSEHLQTLNKNLAALKLAKIGLSKSDFGFSTVESLIKQLKGVALWIAP